MSGTNGRRLRHEIVQAALALVREGVDGHPDLPDLGEQVRRGQTGIAEAARRLLADVLRDRC